MSIKQPVEKQIEATSPRDELIFLFLQLQRSLVLFAISFYQYIDEKCMRKEQLRIGAHILDIDDPLQISAYLKFLKSMKERKLVELATYIHQGFDRSRKFKDFVVTILLYLRLIARAMNPRKVYGDYDKWVMKFDTPNLEEVKLWTQNFSKQNEITLFSEYSRSK